MSDMIQQTFPRIVVRMTEVVDGFTATIWLRTGAGYLDGKLLTDEPVDTIEEARALANRFASERNIAPDAVEIM
jgi:hypothetical protein